MADLQSTTDLINIATHLGLFAGMIGLLWMLINQINTN